MRKAIELTPKEFALLELFLRSGKRVLSRPAIISHLWATEEPPSEEAVKAHIKYLRQKLKAVGAPDDLIETIRGLGYRLKPLA
jgi:DNA-binding response OmpR family regulator